MQVNILCAMRDWHTAQELGMELGDGEHCTFRIATDGLEAIKCCREFAPDILVVDAVLPGIDGLGVIDEIRAQLGDRMPRVIGGSMMHFADTKFRRHGIDALVCVPWQKAELRSALLVQMERFQNSIDWEAAQPTRLKAQALLTKLGMRSSLKGYAYLACAAALVYDNEARLDAVGVRIYAPVADHFDTTPQNVERLIRHAVERTMDGARAKGVYRFFGNTIDPTRGKPTNAQCISALAERLRVEASA